MSSQTAAASVAASLDDKKVHVLLAASGSVATIKLPLIARTLASRFTRGSLSIRIVLTSSSKHFLQGQAEEQPHYRTLASIPGVDGVYLDEDEWTSPGWTRGGSILHIELRRWADLLVVAPLSANTLAKITAGICDDLLACVVRAWDVPAKKRRLQGRPSILVAPAMNTMMWTHPLTETQLSVMRRDWDWFEVLVPQGAKALACGDVGAGAMMEWGDIVNVVAGRVRLLGAQPSS